MSLGRRSFLMAGLSLVATGAEASVARAASLKELCRASDGCVVGAAESASSEWVTLAGVRRIVTRTRFVVERVIAGRDEPELVVRTLGGRVGRIGQTVHGEAVLLKKERCVLFVRAERDSWLVSYLGQGHFPLRRRQGGADELGRSPRVAELVRNGDDAARLIGVELERARAMIDEAWRDAHR